MKPDEINIAIAEFCGIVSQDSHGKLYHTCDGYVRNCPNYYGDLNACRDALLKLPDDLHHEYRRKLYILTKPIPFDMWVHNWAFMTAGPDIVSAAIVRTIGKRRDGQ
jgi:hypothetical protein